MRKQKGLKSFKKKYVSGQFRENTGITRSQKKGRVRQRGLRVGARDHLHRSKKSQIRGIEMSQRSKKGEFSPRPDGYYYGNGFNICRRGRHGTGHGVEGERGKKGVMERPPKK